MRIVKTDRGYIDMDHVLAVGEPYYNRRGWYGFDLVLALRDKPYPMLYSSEELGLVFHGDPKGNSLDRHFHEVREQKIKPFITLWKDAREAGVSS